MFKTTDLKIDKKFEEKVGKADCSFHGRAEHSFGIVLMGHGTAHWTCSQASFWESCAVYRRTSRQLTSPRSPGPGLTVPCKGHCEDVLSEGGFRLCI